MTGNELVVDLATNETGALSSTAAQVVSAINASPAAAALLKAFRYRGFAVAGTGIAQATPRSRLSDFLNAPAHVQRGPFQTKMLRIGNQRDGSKVGVFIYCQQHAREWVTPITCLETAERLLRNYAIDPQTKELLDNLDVFIVPSVNPDGAHYSMYDNNNQRRNLVNRCLPDTFQDPLARHFIGVDLNRNNTRRHVLRRLHRRGRREPGEPGDVQPVHERPLRRPVREVRGRDPERALGRGHVLEHQVRDQHPHLRRLLHVGAGRVHPRRAASRCRRRTSASSATSSTSPTRSWRASRSTATPSSRPSGPARSPTSCTRRRATRPTTSTTARGSSPTRSRPGRGSSPWTRRPARSRARTWPAAASRASARRSRPRAGTRRSSSPTATSACWRARSRTRATSPPPVVDLDSDGVTRATAPPINFRFTWPGEGAVIHYTTDGSTPTLSSPTYEAQGPRRPGQILSLDRLGVHDVKWIAVDIKGNVSPVRTQRFLIGPEATVERHGAAHAVADAGRAGARSGRSRPASPATTWRR